VPTDVSVTPGPRLTHQLLAAAAAGDDDDDVVADGRVDSD